MSWVAAGVAVVGGGIKLYQGMKTKQEGQEMESALDKPIFQIPPEIAKNMSMAEKMEYQGLPEEQKQAYLDNQQRALQSALRSSSDRRGGLGIISQLQGQQNISSRELLLQDVAARRENMQQAMQQREVMAGYKMKRFEHQYNEYSADLDYARALQGAGMQNIQSGTAAMISGVGQGIAGSIGSDVIDDNTDPSSLQRNSNPSGLISSTGLSSGTGSQSRFGIQPLSSGLKSAPGGLNKRMNPLTKKIEFWNASSGQYQ